MNDVRVLHVTGNLQQWLKGTGFGGIAGIRLIQSLSFLGVKQAILDGEIDRQDLCVGAEFSGAKVWYGPCLHDAILGCDAEKERMYSEIGAIIRTYRPSVVHIFQYEVYRDLIIRAAASFGVPVVATALDYGWLCSRTTLIRGCGDICDGKVTVEKCRACLSSGRTWPVYLGRKLASALPSWPNVGQLPGFGFFVREAQANRRRLQATLKDWPVYRDDVSHWIAPSRAMEKFLLQQGVSAEKISHIPFGFDAAVVSSRPERLPVIFGYAGRAIYEKGLHLLAKAFVSLIQKGYDARLRLFGLRRDDNRAYNRTCLSSLESVSNRVDFDGYSAADRESTRQAHGRIHAMIVPSFWYDNLPLTVVESLAHGTPVIASAHSSAAEPLIDGENGLTFDAFNPDSLCQVMARFAADDDLRQRLFAGARYSISSRDEADNVLKVYRRVLECTPTPAEKLSNA